MENVYLFYNHLEYIMDIWLNLWQFGIVCGHWVYISHLDTFGRRKIWQPWLKDVLSIPPESKMSLRLPRTVQNKQGRHLQINLTGNSPSTDCLMYPISKNDYKYFFFGQKCAHCCLNISSLIKNFPVDKKVCHLT
jgi:hypothetical protein